MYTKPILGTISSYTKTKLTLIGGIPTNCKSRKDWRIFVSDKALSNLPAPCAKHLSLLAVTRKGLWTPAGEKTCTLRDPKGVSARSATHALGIASGTAGRARLVPALIIPGEKAAS